MEVIFVYKFEIFQGAPPPPLLDQGLFNVFFYWSKLGNNYEMKYKNRTEIISLKHSLTLKRYIVQLFRIIAKRINCARTL